MKYMIILLIGINIGIFGEFFIPTQYQYPIASGCIKSKNNPNLNFLPRVMVSSDNPNPGYKLIPLYTKESIPSYLVLRDFLLGDIKKLSKEECSAVIERSFQAEDNE